MKKAAGLLAAIALTALGLTPAQAHFQSRRDLNDTPSPIDIKYTAVAHDDTYWFGYITTYDSFTNSSANGRRGAFYFDFRPGGGGRGFFVVIYWNGYKWVGQVKKATYQGSYRVGTAQVVRLDPKRIGFQVKRQIVNGGAARMQFGSRSFYKTSWLCEDGCTDWAPRRSAWYEHT